MKFNITRLCSVALLSLPLLSFAAPNPASQDWVGKNYRPQLSAAVWDAACSSGTTESSEGCYGNVSSSAFGLINQAVGGFTSLANINATNAPNNSVFIKAFFAGTNTPVSGTDITVNHTAVDAARCSLFSQAGNGVNLIETRVVNGSISDPEATRITVITSAGSTISYAQGANSVAINSPLYLVCAGVSIADGSTSAALSGVTAV